MLSKFSIKIFWRHMTSFEVFKISIAKTDVFAIECLDQGLASKCTEAGDMNEACHQLSRANHAQACLHYHAYK